MCLLSTRWGAEYLVFSHMYLLSICVHQLIETLDAKSGGTEGSSGGGFSLYNTPGGIPWLEGKCAVNHTFQNFVYLGCL